MRTRSPQKSCCVLLRLTGVAVEFADGVNGAIDDPKGSRIVADTPCMVTAGQCISGWTSCNPYAIVIMHNCKHNSVNKAHYMCTFLFAGAANPHPSRSLRT